MSDMVYSTSMIKKCIQSEYENGSFIICKNDAMLFSNYCNECRDTLMSMSHGKRHLIKNYRIELSCKPKVIMKFLIGYIRKSLWKRFSDFLTNIDS